MLDQSRANRIAEHIAEGREEMAVLLNRKTLEPTLPHMSMAPVMLVVPPDMARHPPLHEWAQGSLGGRLHDQMKMIRHEADAKHVDGEFGFCRGKQVEESRVVAVFMKDGRPTVPTIQNMVGVPGYLSAWNPRHDAVRYANKEYRGKNK